MKIIKSIILLSTIILSVGCVSASSLEAEAIAACGTAETSRKAAAQLKMEWTTTAKLIKKANTSLQSGDFESAIKMCNKAEFEGNASIKQASIESNLWQSRIPR
ncbi:MAG: hypothetical protein ACI80S_000610 [Pseudohongiellaceae bacterium]|jgi:hypothetical protein